MANLQSISALIKHGTQSLDDISDTARLDTELLLGFSLNKPRTYLFAWPEHTPTHSQTELFTSLLARRASGEPLAYITGQREFWSLNFQVTPDTLIPRPDTELIVELAIQKLSEQQGAVLDLGTGCGTIAITIATEMPELPVVAVDQSQAALEVATNNARNIGVKVQFLRSNWFENIAVQDFRVIAANPPYIAADDPHLLQAELQHEPIEALRSCDNGMADINAIIEQATNYLQPKGWLLIEHGHTQSYHTRELMIKHNFTNVDTMRDLGNNDRVTLGQKP